jgi:hypothetical protein
MNKNFITRTFVVEEEGQQTIKGTEIIGWDPAEEVIRSWTFDSVGGFAMGIWFLENGEWETEIIEDLPPLKPETRKKLADRLDWMIGTWIDNGEDEWAEFNTKWAGDKAYLINQFTMYSEGEVDQEGLVVVGWDSEKGEIRTWMFDTDGGFAEGRGTAREAGWKMKNRHVLPDGTPASSTAIYTKIDDNSFTWRRVAQEVGGELVPDTEDILVVRKTTDENKGMEVTK